MLRNAWLTKIQAGGSAEEFSGPSDAGPERWAGRVPAQWRQSRTGKAGNATSAAADSGSSNTLTNRLLIIEGTLDVVPEVDDVLTIELDEDRGTIVAAAANVDGPRGSRLIARHLRTIRVQLKDA